MPKTLTQRAQERVRRLDSRRREALPLWATNEQVLEQLAPLPSVETAAISLLTLQRQAMAAALRRQRDILRSLIVHRELCARYISASEIVRMERYARRAYPSVEYIPGVYVNLAFGLGIRCECDTCAPWWALCDRGMFRTDRPAITVPKNV